MEFAQPPPTHIGNANLSVPPPSMGGGFGPKMDLRPNYINTNNRTQFRPFINLQRPLPGPLGNMTLEDFDGKRLRKSVMRKTVDYNAAIIKTLETRVWQRDYRDRRALQPDVMYYPDLMPPPSYPDNPINCVTTRFVKTATNKMRCPIFCMAWTPEGRRLVTGASSGEFTLWNGLTFNFETILQAHDSPVRCMVWSHNDSWMVTGDHAGYVKYWQSNMNNVKMFQAHKEALRGISFSPSDSKFVTCSDDGTLRIWDFLRYQEEKILRGHGADVKCVHWHPQKGLIVSGSKDNQQPIKLWDPKSGQSLATLHAHKSTVMDLKWNENGNWLITASRDHLLKLFDLRNLSQEVQTFRGHKKEASSVAWHPTHEGLFTSGGSDGSIMFWHVGADKEVGAIEQAHDSIVWTLAWHPLGHILCSGSNDHTSKFWTRNRPGDLMRDKYNLNTLPGGISGLEELDLTNVNADEPSVIPGMGPEDKVEFSLLTEETTIPGLDLDLLTTSVDERSKFKKVPYSKPIPRNFQAQWNETGPIDETGGTLSEVLSHIVESSSGVIPLQKIASTANGLIMAGKFVCVEPGSKLEAAIAQGPKPLYEFIFSGQVPELHDVMDKIREEYDDVINREYCSDMEFAEDDGEDEENMAGNRPGSPPRGFKRPLLADGGFPPAPGGFDQKEPRFLPPEGAPDVFFEPRNDHDMRSATAKDSFNYRDKHDANVLHNRNSELDYRGRDVDMRGGHNDDYRQTLDFRPPPDDFDDDGGGGGPYNSNKSNANAGFQSDEFQEGGSGARMWSNGPNNSFQNNRNFGVPPFQNFRPPPPVWDNDGPPPPPPQWGAPPPNMHGFNARGGGRMPPPRGAPPRMARGQWGPPRMVGPPGGPRGPPHRGGAPPRSAHRRF